LRSNPSPASSLLLVLLSSNTFRVCSIDSGGKIISSWLARAKKVGEARRLSSVGIWTKEGW
jgi:hypothetical protein